MRSARVFLRASFFSVRTSEEDQGRRFEFLANLRLNVERKKRRTAMLLRMWRRRE